MIDQNKMKVLIVGAGRIAGFNEFDKYRKNHVVIMVHFQKVKILLSAVYTIPILTKVNYFQKNLVSRFLKHLMMH